VGSSSKLLCLASEDEFILRSRRRKQPHLMNGRPFMGGS